jgi:next-to-BRCA1 protein 1
MQPEQGFVQVWTLLNPGPVAWPAGCSVRYTGGDNMLNVDKKVPASTRELTVATETNVISRPVEVGEEIAFRVPLKAPQSDGTKISYWRLKTNDGQAFGHRLWCHIKVAAKTAEPETASLPQVVPQQFAPVTVPTVERSEAVGRPGHRDFLNTVLQQRVDRRRELEGRAAMLSKALERAKAVQEAQRQAEEEQRANRAQMLRNLSTEILAVEIQHKARFGAAKAAIDAANAAKDAAPAPVSELPASTSAAEADFALQLRLLEQHNHMRLAQAKAAEIANAEKAKEESLKEDAPKEETESSRMIFPTLEKESPASSVHDVTTPATLAAPVTTAAETVVASPEVANSEGDIFEDAESVDFVDSSEDGFLTDEEYDILDASDEEFA